MINKEITGICVAIGCLTLMHMIFVFVYIDEIDISPLIKYCGIIASLLLAVLLYFVMKRINHSKSYSYNFRNIKYGAYFLIGVWIIYLFISFIMVIVSSNAIVFAYQQILLALICIPLFWLWNKHNPKSI